MTSSIHSSNILPRKDMFLNTLDKPQVVTQHQVNYKEKDLGNQASGFLMRNLLDSYSAMNNTQQKRLTQSAINVGLMNADYCDPSVNDIIQHLACAYNVINHKQLQSGDSNYQIMNSVRVNFNSNDFDWSFLDNCDAPTKVAYVLCFLASGPVSKSLKDLSEKLIQMGDRSNYLGKLQTAISTVNTFFNNNPQDNIDLFKSFGYWMSTHYPNQNLVEQNLNVSAEDKNFVTYLSTSTPSLFDFMYTALTSYNTQNSKNRITLPMLINGDSMIFDNNQQRGIENFPQQVFMKYFSELMNSITDDSDTANSLGVKIFSNSWYTIPVDATNNGIFVKNTSDAKYRLILDKNDLNNTSPDNFSQNNIINDALNNCNELSSLLLHSQNQVSTLQSYYGTLYNNLITASESNVQMISAESWIGNFE